ncbi:MAG: molybdopterin converting factor subunit 1 [Pseudomonadota bacterium]
MSATIRVLYFASIREKVGCDAEEIELPAGVTTLAALRAHLRGRGGAWAEALAEQRALRAAVNQEMAAPTAAVRPGDEVAFFPPVTGG